MAGTAGAGAPAETPEQTAARIEQARHTATPRREDPADGLPPDAPEAVREAAAGGDLSATSDRDAVDWLLQPRRPQRFRVKTTIETDEGTQPITFVIHQLDSKRIDEVERRNLDEKTGRIDQVKANAELVAEACDHLEGALGHKIDPKSEEFRAGLPSPALAFEQRFHWEAGVLAGVAGEVRRVAGWSPDRVGTAQRVLVETAGN